MPRLIETKKSQNGGNKILSFDVHAKERAIDRIDKQRANERKDFIIKTFLEIFREQIEQNPTAFATRFRKMAESPFKFYRGSATLFYQDLKVDQDQFIEKNPAAGSIFIHGDLHAENFGTMLADDGILNFNVNDFDEGYLGPFTWDVKRLLASLNLICYSKGFSDNEIREVLTNSAQEYVKQVKHFCGSSRDKLDLTLRTTKGKIHELLLKSRVLSHVDHLNRFTRIENYDRRFILNEKTVEVSKELHGKLSKAFENYLKSIPENKKHSDLGYNGGKIEFRIKDIAQTITVGVGSAGKTSYLFLLEGRGETLENDIILFMKPAQKSALSYVVKDDQLAQYFEHDGLRIVLCAYAMTASASRWLGYTTMDSMPFLVEAVGAHSKDLDWTGINDLTDICEVAQYLGKATAKIHCVADGDCENTPKDVATLPFFAIPKNVERAIYKSFQGNEEEFIKEMVDFGMAYGQLVRRDHQLFNDALRNHEIPGIF